MEGRRHAVPLLKLVFKFYEARFQKVLHQLVHRRLHASSSLVQPPGLLLQFHIGRSGLHNGRWRKAASRRKAPVEGLQKVQPVYPHAKGCEPSGKFRPALLPRKMEVAVPLLQNKANPLIISLVLLKMLLHIVVQPPVLRTGAVLADKSAPGQNFEYFPGLDHNASILLVINCTWSSPYNNDLASIPIQENKVIILT